MTRQPKRRSNSSSGSAGGWFGVVLAALCGLFFLFSGVEMDLDHRTLQKYGRLTSGEIVTVYRGRAGPDATVRFVTENGTTVRADVYDTADETDVKLGATMRIRYDPDDPAGLVEDANDGVAATDRWLMTIGGAVLLAAAAFGATRAGQPRVNVHHRRRR